MSILEQILAAKVQEVDRLRPRGPELRTLAARQKPARPFAAALRAGNNVALIAEFKRRSPSAGWIRRDGSVAEIVTDYNESGARAISVLTDEQFFGGTLDDLRTTCDKTSVPVLRKDFVIDDLQLFEARAAGADAVLLIVRACEDVRLRDLMQAAREIGLGVLVEAHDEQEVERALHQNADVIGINNRDLANFQVDNSLARRIANRVPSDVVLVAESGIRHVDEVRQFGEAGIDAVLVGETLMGAENTRKIVREFSSQPKASRG